MHYGRDAPPQIEIVEEVLEEFETFTKISLDAEIEVRRSKAAITWQDAKNVGERHTNDNSN